MLLGAIPFVGSTESTGPPESGLFSRNNDWLPGLDSNQEPIGEQPIALPIELPRNAFAASNTTKNWASREASIALLGVYSPYPGTLPQKSLDVLLNPDCEVPHDYLFGVRRMRSND